MKYQFLKDCELDVLIDYDEEADFPIIEEDVIKKGDIYEGDYDEEYGNINCGDGTILLHVPKSIIKEVV